MMQAQVPSAIFNTCYSLMKIMFIMILLVAGQEDHNPNTRFLAIIPLMTMLPTDVLSAWVASVLLR